MDPIQFIVAAGIGFLAGNAPARRIFFKNVQGALGTGIDALAKMGDANGLQSMVSRPGPGRADVNGPESAGQRYNIDNDLSNPTA